MRKILAIILAISLLCILAVGSTLSYFTDVKFHANTMAVGKVSIVQNQTVDVNTRLYPYIGDAVLDASGLYDTAKNAVTKEVTVTNDGTEAAYVRTLFAFEMEKVGDDWVNPIEAGHIILNGATIVFPGVQIEINSVMYVVGVYTYEAPVAASATTAPSLKQIVLSSTAGNEFYDLVDKQYDILVMSQAVQTQGFAATAEKTVANVALDTAFGEVNAEKAENVAKIADWFKG